MSDYQFCTLNSGGLDIHDHNAECLDDEAAVAQASSILIAGGIVEVWSGLRNVAIVTVPFAATQKARIVWGHSLTQPIDGISRLQR